MYYMLLALHIVFVSLWFGGGVFLMVLAHMGYKRGLKELSLVSNLGASSAAFFGAVSGFTLLSGIGIMFIPNIGYSWGEPFISIGFTVFFVCSLVEARVLRPAFRRLGEAATTLAEAQTNGQPAPEDATKALASARMRVLLSGSINIVLIAVAMISMIIKL